MSAPAPLVWNVFDEPSLGLRPHGLWRHPENRRAEYDGLDRWAEEARIADRAGFTSLFLADVLGLYDVYGAGPEGALGHAVEVPILDPLVLASALIGRTEHLGLVITGSTTYEHPFAWARRLSSLDALSGGRIGWNVVTSYLDSAARNFGIDGQPGHDDRYERAEEFLEVCLRLWEGSWSDTAARRDGARITAIDPAEVRPIGFAGEHFRVAGPHLLAPTPQRTPLIAQAGASPRGLAFAARYAEVVFVQAGEAAGVARTAARVREAAVDAGRDAQAVRPLAGLLVITGDTDEQARRRAAELEGWHDPLGDEIAYSAATGVDFAALSGTDLFPPRDGGGRSVRSARGQFGDRRAVSEIRGAFGRLDTGLFCVVGSPATVAERIGRLAEQTGLSGFNLYSALGPASLTEFVELVVPELRARGLFPDPPGETPRTLRERLPGTSGTAYHLAAEYRRTTPGHGTAGARQTQDTDTDTAAGARA